MMMKNKKIALFSPRFFDYPEKICDEIRKQGGQAFFFDERPFTSSLGKILLRLNITFLTTFFIRSYYHNMIKKVKEINPDYIIFLSPESVRREDIIAFKKNVPDAKIIIYMWDSFLNKPYSKNYIDVADAFLTFDKNDAEQYGLEFLPLFYIKEYEQLRCQSHQDYDFCFIGTVHSNRVQAVKTLIARSHHNNFTFFYCPSKLLFILKKIFTHEFSGLKFKDVSFKPLTKDTLMDVIARSRCIIDISHPKQKGLTMRTIESVGAGKKIATTNINIKQYDFYNENLHYIIDSEFSPIPEDFISASVNLNKEIYCKYRIDNWLTTLLLSTKTHN
ncbi:lipopolysaccharide biosynthesis protein [Franconibacter daqui]